MSMMKLPRRPLTVIIISICVLIVLAGARLLAREGFQHIEPASMLRQAEQDWEAGHRGQSLKGYIQASTMAVDAGARWTFARFYINRMASNRSAGKIDRALANCSRAVAILHSYDDEGSLSYECFTLEAESTKQDELTAR